jgi:hypothetical protein
MTDLQAIADRIEIEALRAEYTDAAMMRDHDRLASLFTDDAVLRTPDADVEQAGRRDGRSIVNYALYYDRYRRTLGGWRFTERVYEVRYFDTTPLPGTPDVTWAAADSSTGPAR